MIAVLSRRRDSAGFGQIRPGLGTETGRVPKPSAPLNDEAAPASSHPQAPLRSRLDEVVALTTTSEVAEG
jgi:hypothetical protein